MKISEALNLLNSADPAAVPYEVRLLTGFTPLHLQTFLAARLQLELPKRHVRVSSGLFGSLASELEKAVEIGVSNVAIVLEWSDVDPRLGYRTAAAWDSAMLLDVESAAPLTFSRLLRSIEKLQKVAKVVLCPPTLPFPPLFANASWEAAQLEMFLLKTLAEFNFTIAGVGVPLANVSRLAEDSPVTQRHDLRSELFAGFPYSLTHADAVASVLSRLLYPPAAKKGLITDLDETMWSGTIGEDGVEGIHWDLDRHSQIHALYQSLLASLANSGALIGVASKNDPKLVRGAFDREDLLLGKERIFPMEVHWQSKAASVTRILRTWNVAADAVVFVDDNPAELAEVAEAHAGIECIQFTARDCQSAQTTLRRIRDLFGKSSVSSEDALRLDSLREGAQFQEAAISEADAESFLRKLRASIGIEYDSGATDRRALELVNKTNQFNMNGIRYTESDWAAEISRPGTTLMTANYEDRFGKLGKIGVVLGRLEDGCFRIKVWVMSCRAFGRRIEYLCLRECLHQHSCPLLFEFESTPKNGPFREFLNAIFGHESQGARMLNREQFERVCPPLYQNVIETKGATIHG